MELNISDLYRAIEDSRLNAFESAKVQSLDRLQSNLNAIGSSYRQSVTGAQNTARISALGQEEKLAAGGLSGGSAYASPTSGYTETARVTADNNLRSNLSSLSAARLQQEQAARSDSSAEIAQAEQEYSSSMTSIGLQRAQAAVNQYNTDRQYQYTVHNAAYEQAMARWQTYGVVLPADAATLGVAAGTRTASSSYNNAKLALERWKALIG